MDCLSLPLAPGSWPEVRGVGPALAGVAKPIGAVLAEVCL
jgi:hypothetical protein